MTESFWLRRVAPWLIIFMISPVYGQKIENVGGVKIIHNGKKGAWGDNVPVSLTLVRTIGELEAQDENAAFYLPSDIAADTEGNIYILDSGNHRIQKFNPQGKYLATFGRKGQGPAEFYFPRSLDVDEKGFIYVCDPQNKRIQILMPDGKEQQNIQLKKEGREVIRCLPEGRIVTNCGASIFFGLEETESKEIPKLIEILDATGKSERQLGEGHDYGHFLLNRVANHAHFATDNAGYIYLAFSYQNRVEKLTLEGKKIWQADRELGYSTEPKDKGKIERKGGGVSILNPQLNLVSVGVAVDRRGRVWVATLKRQLKKEEQVGLAISMTMAAGQRTMTMKAHGNTELRETDAFQLEIFDSEGILLGKVSLNHFVDGIRIFGDRLFLLDQLRGNQVYEYKVEEKN